MPPLQQPPPQVRRPPRTFPSDAAATSSIERFDPTALRCEVLRRFALESSRSMAERERLRLEAIGEGSEPEDQLLLWLASVASAAWRLLRCHNRAAATEPATTAAETNTAAMAEGSTATPSNGSATEPARSGSSSNGSGVGATVSRVDSAATGQAVASSCKDGSSTANATGSAAKVDVCEGATETAPSKLPERVNAAVSWARGVLGRVEEYVKLSVFLAFPKGSLFADPAVEELFQRHCMQYWTPRFDWSLAAVVQMLAWDLAAGLGHRFAVVLRFYAMFAAMVFSHKMLFIALRGRPRGWRLSRGLLLCSFLLGRGVVCHPILPAAFPEAKQELSPNPDMSWLLYEVARSGVVATSLILALQLHKLDTLLVCGAHGLACACWAGLAALHMPSNDALWHHPAAVHLLVTFGCVWQQHELERLGRHSFEQELLMERGRLLRASESLTRQGTQVDFTIGMQLLYHARSVEHLNF